MLSMKNNRLIWALLIGAGLWTSCKKADVQASNLSSNTSTNSSSDADSAALLTKDVYLWTEQIPVTFKSSDYSDPNAMMQALHQYSHEPGYTQPVDRWSFAMKKDEWNKMSGGYASMNNMTSNGDMGFGVFFLTQNDLRVKAVQPESPAGRAGVRRGWRVTQVNGSTNLTTSNSDFIVQNVYTNTSGTFVFQKPDGSSVTLSLTAASYHEHPVLLDTMYNVNGRKIGYFVFNSFLGDTNEVYNNFSRIFSKFSSAGINDLVVDLRYNGGGYVTMQEKLADYIAPSSADGGLMMKQIYNKNNSQYNSSTYFHKKGSLNLPRVIFIVTKGTASASELLINNLRPYMDVELVGPTSTHGKPVGFFPIPVKDWYIFPVSFRSTNKNGEGNYFDGLSVNGQVADGLDKDWGDREEASLASAINYSVNGALRIVTGTQSVTLPITTDVINSNSKLDQTTFKGAIDVRRMR